MVTNITAAPVTGLSFRLNDQPLAHAGAYQGGNSSSQGDSFQSYNPLRTLFGAESHELTEAFEHTLTHMGKLASKRKGLEEQQKRDPNSKSLAHLLDKNKEEHDFLKQTYEGFVKTMGESTINDIQDFARYFNASV